MSAQSEEGESLKISRRKIMPTITEKPNDEENHGNKNNMTKLDMRIIIPTDPKLSKSHSKSSRKLKNREKSEKYNANDGGDSSDEDDFLSNSPSMGDKKPSEMMSRFDENSSRDFPIVEEPLTIMKRLEQIIESHRAVRLFIIFTIWTLYDTDIKYAATNKNADLAFEIIISIIFFVFLFEITIRSYCNVEYFHLPAWQLTNDEGKVLPENFYERWKRIIFTAGSFYFWCDIIATATLVVDIKWIIGQSGISTINGGTLSNAESSNAIKQAARVLRLIRLARMTRLTRIAKLESYFERIFYSSGKPKIENQQPQQPQPQHQKGDISEEKYESKVGAAMANLINQRVLVLFLLIIIVISLLNITDPDISLVLGGQLVHKLNYLNATNPSVYRNGLILATNSVIRQLPVVKITFDHNDKYYYDDSIRNSLLRPEEKIELFYSTNITSTSIVYSNKQNLIVEAQYSIYLTSIFIVLLFVAIFDFSIDAKRVVIVPIEKLVVLVKKIAENPLKVEYDKLGVQEGFKEGMETTVLLNTITKIGALMKVGFGEAGADIIAKNLQAGSGGAGGKLNLLGKGNTIQSIFGFCDVRQFTDTTECLQEEVMLFVNRIAHILHSIVVQCSGAANKNIGDAFLLTWKLHDRATNEQKSLLADQALLTFCKALIELARHQEFICNFSVAASARLFKRFPDYKVRIGSGLHVGWAVEGAIGSHRKIDATYISPHVSATEFLESSTKEYGVSLLLSEPFYNLLSKAAQKHVRKVDKVLRSPNEPSMGLYTYDCDLSIDWNDPYRHKKIVKQEAAAPKGIARLKSAASRIAKMGAKGKAQIKNAPLGAGGSNTATSHEEKAEGKADDHVVRPSPTLGARPTTAGEGSDKEAGTITSTETSPQASPLAHQQIHHPPPVPPQSNNDNSNRRTSVSLNHPTHRQQPKRGSVISTTSGSHHPLIPISENSAQGSINTDRERHGLTSVPSSHHSDTASRKTSSMIDNRTTTPTKNRRPSALSMLAGGSSSGPRRPTVYAVFQNRPSLRQTANGGKSSVVTGNSGGGGGYDPLSQRDLNDEEKGLTSNSADQQKIIAQQALKKKKETPTITVPVYSQAIWTEDLDLIDLRHAFTESMHPIWSEGIDAWENGDWETAKVQFTTILKMSKGKDGPAKKMLLMIEEHNEICPEPWHGFNDLTGEGGH